MTIYYADSSALVKRHLTEAGSRWVKQELSAANGNQVFSSELSIVEVLSAMNRRQREKSISAAQYTQISGDFLAFVQTEYEMLELSDAVFIEAQRLLETYPLRAGDSIQLASAVLANNELRAAQLPALIFLASDARLLAAAASENLAADNPLNHP